MAPGEINTRHSIEYRHGLTEGPETGRRTESSRADAGCHGRGPLSGKPTAPSLQGGGFPVEGVFQVHDLNVPGLRPSLGDRLSRATPRSPGSGNRPDPGAVDRRRASVQPFTPWKPHKNRDFERLLFPSL